MNEYLERLRKQLYLGMCAERRILLLAVCTMLWWNFTLKRHRLFSPLLPSPFTTAWASQIHIRQPMMTRLENQY